MISGQICHKNKKGNEEIQDNKPYLCALLSAAEMKWTMSLSGHDRKLMGMTLILTLLIVLVAVLLLGIRVFFVKGGKFPNTHIDANKALRDKGIHCASHEDTISRRNRGI